MTMVQLKEKARGLGVKLDKKAKKEQLVHSIQEAEGYNQCFGKAQGCCEQSDCCFRSDCLRIK